MISQRECQRRDRILRDYIHGRDWDEDTERRLVRTLVLGDEPLLKSYPYLVGLEWDATLWGDSVGRGDLLFSDGCGGFAVVEVKSVDGAQKRNVARQKVRSQARRYAEALRSMLPDANVVPMVFSDDQHPPCQGLQAVEE